MNFADRFERDFDSTVKQLSKGVKRVVRSLEKNWRRAEPHAKRTAKKEKFFLARAGSTIKMTKAERRAQDVRERTKGKCEWCGRRGTMHNRFNCAIYKHSLCKRCQSDRVHMLGYGLI